MMMRRDDREAERLIRPQQAIDDEADVGGVWLLHGRHRRRWRMRHYDA